MQALWMVAGAFFFATMGVFVKYASASFTTAEIVFYRGLIGMLVLWWLTRRQGISLATRHPWMHGWRSLVGVTAMSGWFYAVTQMPLATGMTFNYMSSLWIAAFLVASALWTWRPGHTGARRSLNVPLLLTIALGFVGVLLLLQPSFAQQQGVAALAGLSSGILSAMAYMQVSALSRAGEPEARTVFYFCLGCSLGGGAVMATWGTSPWPGLGQALWLLPVGLLAAGGQLCMTKAYAAAQSPRATLVVANLQYTGLIFASAYSLLLFDDAINTLGWLGMALVAASGIAATVLRARQARQQAVAAPASAASTGVVGRAARGAQ